MTKQENLEAIVAKIDHLSEGLKKLTKEYCEAVEAENKKFHLLQDLEVLPYKRYFLVEIKTGETKVYGPGERIKSYCRLRSIKKDLFVKNETLKNLFE